MSRTQEEVRMFYRAEELPQLAPLMEQKRWTERSLAKSLGCTRYLLRQILAHAPETEHQYMLARKAVDFLNSDGKGIPHGVPIYGEVPAGPMSPFEGDPRINETIQMEDLDPKVHFALRVHG